MARKLGDALPGGDLALRTAVWLSMRPMPLPRLTRLTRDVSVPTGLETTVDSWPSRGRAPEDPDLSDEITEAACGITCPSRSRSRLQRAALSRIGAPSASRSLADQPHG
jgi:hypothetical protein